MAEGESGDLDDFLAAIGQEMSPYITDVATETLSPGLNRFTGFSVRF
jgi:hypothetical protein